MHYQTISAFSTQERLRAEELDRWKRENWTGPLGLFLRLIDFKPLVY